MKSIFALLAATFLLTSSVFGEDVAPPSIPVDEMNKLVGSKPGEIVPPTDLPPGYSNQLPPGLAPQDVMGNPDQPPPDMKLKNPSFDTSNGIPQSEPIPQSPNVNSRPNGSEPDATSLTSAPGTEKKATQKLPTPISTSDPSEIIQKRLRAIIKTTIGTMEFKLFSRYSPHTVENFVGLATGEREFRDVKSGLMVRRPFYTGLIFHRVIPGFLAQTGCPYGNGRGGPNYAIKDEFHPNLRFEKAGLLAMANVRDAAGQPMPDSAGSQFFITLGAQPSFNDKYSIFGEIISGTDVLKKFNRLKIGPTDRPVKRIYVQNIEIVEEKELP